MKIEFSSSLLLFTELLLYTIIFATNTVQPKYSFIFILYASRLSIYFRLVFGGTEQKKKNEMEEVLNKKKLEEVLLLKT